MQVRKRNGKIENFSHDKIIHAICAAFNEIDGSITNSAKNKSREIAQFIEAVNKDVIDVEEIQDIVEDKLMACSRKDVARAYIRYRYKHELRRRENTTDETILELVGGKNEYWNTENSNKNSMLVTTQRDYIAGATSTDISRRLLLDEDLVAAHDEGIIHFHDIDYFLQEMSNCCLINLNDILQNGTVVNGVMIEKPHKFLTACTIATQIILGVSSSQYGGCTINLAHLAPFVRDSYNRYLETYKKRGLSDEQAKQFANEDTKKEIAAGVQTFNYQVNSMSNTNGQSPFLSVFMYLGDTKEYKKELADIIEEFLKQRILGLKNKNGVYVTQAFPKLLYTLEPDNIEKDAPYWYLTELAAKCTAKRMVPDYISEKIMLENKINMYGDGDVYGCMGCVDKQEIVSYQYNNESFIEPIGKMWNKLSKHFEIKTQPNGEDFYMETPNVMIYDQKKGWVENYGMIKNHSSQWLHITFSNGETITCTPNHPFEDVTGKIVFAKDLTEETLLDCDSSSHCYKSDKVEITQFCHITKVEYIEQTGFSYDVTTSSEHFTVSGIYSHNCRSFLTPWRVGKNISNAKDYQEGKGKYWGRLTYA